ncbi:hypothetical protein [Undibacterium sp. CY21W]|uniref:hypothetical protein n=1 Tax=Undibacterium sp. CY21W TaxID=2762293 RepID=UPI00164C6F3C|nr:hypothetical protein [Undibacterium sp. CY21W]MBC3927412.1 hypothetical protein [Undibacterium sp. CY21W]
MATSKTPFSPDSTNKQTQKGQAMIEYVIVTGVLVAVLFVPHELTNNMAPADYLARSIATFFRGFSYLISVF